ncbi:MAG: hypothetical protein HRU09_18990 [Oligoflexales bacterium]|nr:hypothetical protein [Oligoflexales bacterium]
MAQIRIQLAFSDHRDYDSYTKCEVYKLDDNRWYLKASAKGYGTEDSPTGTGAYCAAACISYP